MIDNPTLSVGLPVYNGENYLAEAIGAILSQSFTDFELILCDNASTDGTQAICEQFAAQDARVRYIRHATNQGLIWNFNHAFEVANGVYFKWMSHDDLIAVDFVKRCVETLQADPDLVVCCASASVIDAEGYLLEIPAKALENVRDPMGVTQLRDRPGPERGLEDHAPCRRHRGVLLESTRCYEEFGVIRSSAIRKTALREYYPGSEKVFLTELSLVGKIKVLPETLMFMRVHDERLSSQASAGGRMSLYLPPGERRRGLSMPRQVRCAWGYWRALWRQPITFPQRMRCVWNFTRFLFQVRKWWAVLAIALLGREPIVRSAGPTRGRRIDQAHIPTPAPAAPAPAVPNVQPMPAHHA